MSHIVTFIGLIILALAVGHKYEEFYGWCILGVSFTAIGVVGMILAYLDGRKPKQPNKVYSL